MMPSDSGNRRAASGGALERKKTARATRTRRAATISSVLRVRRLILTGPGQAYGRLGQEFSARNEFGPPTSIADRNRYFTTEKVYILP